MSQKFNTNINNFEVYWETDHKKDENIEWLVA